MKLLTHLVFSAGVTGALLGANCDGQKQRRAGDSASQSGSPAPTPTSVDPEKSNTPTCAVVDLRALLASGNDAAIVEWIACRRTCTEAVDCEATHGVCGDEEFLNVQFADEYQTYTELRNQASECAEPIGVKPLPIAACVDGSCSRSSVGCNDERDRLWTFLSALDRGCSVDTDCHGFYALENGCQAAVILGKHALADAETAERLTTLQQAVRTVCPQPTVACSPQPFKASCLAGICAPGVQN